MALYIDPVFTVDLVKNVDSIVDHKIKDLRRMSKPKNDTDTTNSTLPTDTDEFDLESLKNFDPNMFDPTKMNLDP